MFAGPLDRAGGAAVPVRRRETVPAEITAVIEDSARNFAFAGYGLWLIRETAATADTVGAMAAATAVAAISLCGTEALLPLRLTPATPPPGGKFSSATCASRVGISQLG
jgi:hypothetical protein